MSGDQWAGIKEALAPLPWWVTLAVLRRTKKGRWKVVLTESHPGSPAMVRNVALHGRGVWAVRCREAGKPWPLDEAVIVVGPGSSAKHILDEVAIGDKARLGWGKGLWTPGGDR